MYFLKEYLQLKGITVESYSEGTRESHAEREPEQIQTSYFAQETQGGDDNEMPDIEITEEPTGKLNKTQCSLSATVTLWKTKKKTGYYSEVERLTLLLLNTTCPILANSVDPDQMASEEFLSKPQIKEFDWLEIRSGLGILVYSARKGLNTIFDLINTHTPISEHQAIL